MISVHSVYSVHYTHIPRLKCIQAIGTRNDYNYSRYELAYNWPRMGPASDLEIVQRMTFIPVNITLQSIYREWPSRIPANFLERLLELGQRLSYPWQGRPTTVSDFIAYRWPPSTLAWPYVTALKPSNGVMVSWPRREGRQHSNVITTSFINRMQWV